MQATFTQFYLELKGDQNEELIEEFGLGNELP